MAGSFHLLDPSDPGTGHGLGDMALHCRGQLADGNEHRSLGLRRLLDDLDLPRFPVIGIRERQPSRGLVPQLLLLRSESVPGGVADREITLPMPDRHVGDGVLQHVLERVGPPAGNGEDAAIDGPAGHRLVGAPGGHGDGRGAELVEDDGVNCRAAAQPQSREVRGLYQLLSCGGDRIARSRPDRPHVDALAADLVVVKAIKVFMC